MKAATDTLCQERSPLASFANKMCVVLLSLLAEARCYVGFSRRKRVMVTCRWQVRLAFLCVASWVCACRDLSGVAVVFLFLAVVFRGVLVWEPRCSGSSRDVACRFAGKLGKVAWTFGRSFLFLCSGSVAACNTFNLAQPVPTALSTPPTPAASSSVSASTPSPSPFPSPLSPVPPPFPP